MKRHLWRLLFPGFWRFFTCFWRVLGKIAAVFPFEGRFQQPIYQNSSVSACFRLISPVSTFIALKHYNLSQQHPSLAKSLFSYVHPPQNPPIQSQIASICLYASIWPLYQSCQIANMCGSQIVKWVPAVQDSSLHSSVGRAPAS